jgi:electron transfer flavoprotein alpha subunit
MSSLLTYIAVNNGKIKRSSLEVLSKCTQEAKKLNLQSSALIIDENASEYIEQLGSFGIAKVYTVEGSHFKHHLNTPYLKALSAVMSQVKPKVMAFASTEGSKDIIGALAANQGVPALPDMSEFEVTENGVKGKRPVMAAKIISNVEAEGESVIISVRSGSYDIIEASTNPETEAIEVNIGEDDIKATLKDIITVSGERIDLSEAGIVVAAGRGVKDEEGRNLITELAGLLNAGIGASRALTESGDYDPSLQIGQTGKVVSPQLYIAVGISGAIQHVAGITNSKVIVAINKDPDAPIFDIADYGIVGDLYKVLPPFIDELKKIKGE